MARHRFLIRYSNGFKRHVSKQERDILSASLQQVGPREYLCTASIQQDLEQSSGPSFLSGRFIFEHKGKKKLELMQSVSGMVRELSL
jgi:hypothetical protein